MFISQRGKNSIKPIRLGKRLIGSGEPVFIVADIANTHEGSFSTAKRMVDEIKDSGIDCVKLQLHIHEAEMLPSHPKFLTQKKRSLSIGEIAALKKHIEDNGMYFLCTPFSREAVDQLESIGVDAFKIGSGEANDLPFLEYIAKKKKTVILSTGMTTLKEIDEAVKIFKRYDLSFMIFHNVSVYPPQYELLNLGNIQKLQKRYHVPIGLSDHTPEIYSSIAAVPCGASLIEKHYTPDRNTVGTSDHKVSLEANEFAILVDAVRKVEKAIGNKKKIFTEERSVIEWAQHSVISLTDIPAGVKITEKMISTKRPLMDGIPAKYLPKILGKRAVKDIKKDSQIKYSDIK